MKKKEQCAYCTRWRKLFRCAMLSAHCKECCVNDCAGVKRVNHIDEAMKMAKEMGGASWPSVDCTRRALINLAARISSHVGEVYQVGMKKKALVDSILLSCGLIQNRKKEADIRDLIKAAEDKLK